MLKDKNKLTGLIIALIVVFIMNIPFLVAFLATPDGKSFSGQNSWFDPWDINVYVSAIRWAQEHPFEFRNLYTTDVHSAPIAYPLYTLFGTLLPDIDPFLIYNLLKIIAGIFLVLVVYQIANNYISKTKDAVIVTILTLFAGGFGWMIHFLPDLTRTPLIFYEAFQKPHAAIASGFYMASLYLLFKYINSKLSIKIIYSSITLLLVLILNPSYSLSYFLITIFYSLYLLKTQQIKFVSLFKKYLIIGTVALPVLIYYARYLLSSSQLKGAFFPNLPIPSPVILTLGYGVLVPLIIVILFKKRKENTLYFLSIWFFISILLAYAPLPFSQYYLRGLYFPAILIVFIYFEIISDFFRISKKYIKKILIGLIPLTTIIILLASSTTALITDNNWIFLENEKVEMFNYLQDNTKRGDGVIVNDYITANQIPAYTANSVYFGHYHQSPNSGEKLKQLQNLCSKNQTKEQVADFLKQNNIKFIIVVNNEEQPSCVNEIPIIAYNIVRPKFNTGNIMIFSVGN